MAGGIKGTRVEKKGDVVVKDYAMIFSNEDLSVSTESTVTKKYYVKI